MSTFGPGYDQNDDDSSDSSSVSATLNDEALPSAGSDSEYIEDEDHDEDTGEFGNGYKWETFKVVSGANYFPLNDGVGTVLIGLKQGQEVMISGSYRLQIAKGGIKYNGVHYNASWRNISIWHPTCSSMSPIMSSFYADWDERTFIPVEASRTSLKHENFECILKVSSRCSGLLDIVELNSTFKDLWIPQDYRPEQGVYTKPPFCVVNKDTLRDTTSIAALKISESWHKSISELTLFHKNSPHDMRVVVLGGKNSGKSTFLRLLAQTLLHADNQEDEFLYFLDIDPGQAEFSRPDCISLSKVGSNLELGNHLGQAEVEQVREYYVGTSSPHVFPTKYLSDVSRLVESFNEENFMGTALLNVPGWIKGFGVQIMNDVINRFKPTHVVFIDSNSRSEAFINELQIKPTFSTPQREEYEPCIHKIDGYHGSPTSGIHSRLHASHLRLFRLLAHFHKTENTRSLINYDFTPLIRKAPLQVSFGPGPVKAFDIVDFNDTVSDDGFKDILDGSVVGVFRFEGECETHQGGKFPILKQGASSESFVSLGLIHSVNTKESYINIYIPESTTRSVCSRKNSKWLIRRCKTATPLCELFPSNKELSVFRSSELPFLSFHKQAKYEFIWKVRRNILRRGHQNR
ncbi:LAQU0S07e05072g1_1 [Lachancea quebecensis]|uniref:Polynucleotide 5'-hydroxyl-kinase GRC3 n=1 Tax=Lachancea quebecensis TaxID=1654605 RepID=A0A0N7MLR2_9SACH|nr:LAQU0S07e05072g1_1 [Lachancea quebecensis]